MQRRWKLLPVFAGLALMAFVLVWVLTAPPTLPPLPEPNGYDFLVRAGSQVAKLPDDPGHLPDDELARLVANHETALRAASDLVPRYLSAVPLDPEISKPIGLHDKPRSRPPLD